MSRYPYPTDLTDTEWAGLQPLLAPARGQRPVPGELRELVNAVLYVLNGGCGGDLLPHEFPPWLSVTQAVQQWQQDGTWGRTRGRVPAGRIGSERR